MSNRRYEDKMEVAQFLLKETGESWESCLETAEHVLAGVEKKTASAEAK